MANVTFEIKNQVAHVRLSRPEKHNAFNEETIAELIQIFEEIPKSKARVLLLESIGKSFSAGGDLAWMKKMAKYTKEENLADAQRLAKMLKLLNECPIPTVGKIQGPAYGGGVGLVACCDIAIASSEAKFCLSEVKLGLSPATISPYVIKAMGQHQARRYFLTAEIFSAEKALQMDLVHEVCPPEALEQTTQTILRHLLRNGPEALAIAKSLVYLTEPIVNNEILSKTAQQIASQRVSPEGQEGLAAFFEKRTAKWIDPASIH